MIQLNRERTVDAIPTSLRGADRVTKKLELLAIYRRGSQEFKSSDFDSGYWRPAKDQLRHETAGKCAYCEAPVSAVAHGDVEHFRPKSEYWWLAYTYDNYLFSCQICNQSHKRDNFPAYGTRLAIDPPLPDPFPTNLSQTELEGFANTFAPDPLDVQTGHTLAAFIRAAATEQPGLIDPYMVDPEPFFSWEADDVLKEVRLQPRDDGPRTVQVFADVEKHLGLNREELRWLRWDTYAELEIYKGALADTTISAALRPRVSAAIEDMMKASAPFAGMVRYFVNDVWNLTFQ